jgi:hypothetical protein
MNLAQLHKNLSDPPRCYLTYIRDRANIIDTMSMKR